MSLINKKQVKTYVHERGKQLDSAALEAIEHSAKIILDRAIANSGHFSRIRESEVYYGINKTF